MDTLKILLGATLAVVLGLLITFLARMRHDVSQSPAEEVARMRQQLQEIDAEMHRLQDEKERKLLREAAAAPAPTDAVTRQEVDADREALEARLRQLEQEANSSKEEALRAEEEAKLLTQQTAEGRDRSARRSRVINDATLVARIAQWQEDPNYGDFAILTIVSPDNVQPGAVLALRRNGGVLGKFEVSDITPDGAVANPVTHFTDVKPQVGDELILNEVAELAQ